MEIGQVDVLKRMIDDTSDGQMKVFDRDWFQKPKMGTQEVFLYKFTSLDLAVDSDSYYRCPGRSGTQLINVYAGQAIYRQL